MSVPSIFEKKPTFIPDPSDVNENKYLCILCYIGFLFFIPLIAKPQSRFVKYHANQGLILFIFEVATGVVLGLLSVIFGIFHLGFLVSILRFAISAVSLLLMVFGIVAACEGHVKPLPILGDIFVAIKY